MTRAGLEPCDLWVDMPVLYQLHVSWRSPYFSNFWSEQRETD